MGRERDAAGKMGNNEVLTMWERLPAGDGEFGRGGDGGAGSMISGPSYQAAGISTPLANARCFLDTQFPVAKLSVESYKERKADHSQTLTGLGKWWGCKPLVLVRAAILGPLMPASDDLAKDKETFLKLTTMDQETLRRRKKARMPAEVIHEYTTRGEREKFF
jgi:hypothetical protein